MAVSTMANDYNSPLIRQRLAMRDGLKCFYCDHPFTDTMEGWNNTSIDHVIPHADKGSDDISNLVLCCTNCNSSKGKRSFVINSPALNSFRLERSMRRKHDEKWVKMVFGFIKKEKERGKSNWPNILPVFVDTLNSIMGFKSTFVDSGLGKGWVKILCEKNIWFFEPERFILQPYFFLPEWNNRNSPLSKRVAELGFYDEEYPCMKYIRPFNSDEISIGITEIISEIQKINGIRETQ
jgi:hypothetical protein